VGLPVPKHSGSCAFVLTADSCQTGTIELALNRVWWTALIEPEYFIVQVQQSNDDLKPG
jgi:hypothetical protein